MNANELPTITWRKRMWYVDRRLGELRPVDNPHEFEPLSTWLKTLKKPVVLRYWATGEEGLKNGSFVREIAWPEGDFSFTRFINGDFMGEVPEVICERLDTFDIEYAQHIIPECCQ